ncbi:MAG: MBOAT family protein [Azospirillaceae bacterium]|nr:MBOAT family protein [Azospirillaceae bacterium]
MLFNSYGFIFAYLPIVLIGFFVVGRWHALAAAAWLAAASLIFYSWWNWHFTFVLMASVGINYAVGVTMVRWQAAGQTAAIRWLLRCAVAADLGALGYFKYANFFVATVGQLSPVPIEWQTVVLPIGISFFTFTQIAFLVDTARQKAGEVNFIHYLLFVTYFPHLIAGPILHHGEMMPQFRQRATYLPRADAIAIGLTMFIAGLFKKVVLADSIAVYADKAFSPAASHTLTLIDGWGGALAYTLQIYFDFSAYCDMAIGVSRMFNIRLPANFESPYQARSIIDFWRRWHMTLSRFLRDYLYIPLGGNRDGQWARCRNLMVTMTLGGLWHGAGWTFVIWGMLHGSFLMVNHGWQRLRSRLGWNGGAVSGFAGWLLTFLAVVVAWVFFRAPDLGTAVAVLRAMAGLQGVVMPVPWEHGLPGPALSLLAHAGVTFGNLAAFAGGKELAWLGGLLAVALFLPNLRQIMAGEVPMTAVGSTPGAPAGLRWRPHPLAAMASFAMFLVALDRMTNVSQFLYFQF